MAYTPPAPDSPEGYEYEPAPGAVQAAMRRRFGDSGITATDPERPGYYRHDVGNWWDGCKSVQDNGDGSYTYTNPYTGEPDRFDANGSWWRDGTYHPWSE